LLYQILIFVWILVIISFLGIFRVAHLAASYIGVRAD
jgi:hypothetical protein